MRKPSRPVSQFVSVTIRLTGLEMVFNLDHQTVRTTMLDTRGRAYGKSEEITIERLIALLDGIILEKKATA